MGHGSINYRLNVWLDWMAAAKRTLVVIEAILYFVFVADCFVCLAGAAATKSYYPAGGGSLIVLLLLIAAVHRICCGRDYS